MTVDRAQYAAESLAINLQTPLEVTPNDVTFIVQLKTLDGCPRSVRVAHALQPIGPIWLFADRCDIVVKVNKG